MGVTHSLMPQKAKLKKIKSFSAQKDYIVKDCHREHSLESEHKSDYNNIHSDVDRE